jgi:hypothetical protein
LVDQIIYITVHLADNATVLIQRADNEGKVFKARFFMMTWSPAWKEDIRPPNWTI